MLIACGLWIGAKTIFRLPEYLLPSPLSVAKILFEKRTELLSHALVTASEAFLGLLVSVVFGFISGVLLFHFRSASRFALPIFTGSQAIPIIATAPLFMLWFGPGLLSKVLLASVLCYFPILLVTIKGLGQYSDTVVDVMRVQGASALEIFKAATLPGSVPSIMNGVRTSAAMAFMGAIVAEYAGAPKGLGYVIIQASYRTDTSLLFASLTIAFVFSLVLISIVEACDDAFLSRYRQYS